MGYISGMEESYRNPESTRGRWGRCGSKALAVCAQVGISQLAGGRSELLQRLPVAYPILSVPPLPALPLACRMLRWSLLCTRKGARKPLIFSSGTCAVWFSHSLAFTISATPADAAASSNAV